MSKDEQDLRNIAMDFTVKLINSSMVAATTKGAIDKIFNDVYRLLTQPGSSSK